MKIATVRTINIEHEYTNHRVDNVVDVKYDKENNIAEIDTVDGEYYLYTNVVGLAVTNEREH